MNTYYPNYPKEKTVIEGHEAGESPPYVLHSVTGIVLAGIFGSAVAAGVVMAVNYFRLGRKLAAVSAFALSFLALIGIMLVLGLIPILEKIPDAVFAIAFAIGIYYAASACFAERLSKHAAAGGRIASKWWGVFIGIMCIPIAIAIFFGTIYLVEVTISAQYPPGVWVKFDKDQVYISGDATKEDAEKLAEVLKEIGYFGSGETYVGLEITSGEHSFYFIANEGDWNDIAIVRSFGNLAQTFAHKDFPMPLKLHICNQNFDIQKTIEIDETNWENEPYDSPVPN